MLVMLLVSPNSLPNYSNLLIPDLLSKNKNWEFWLDSLAYIIFILPEMREIVRSGVNSTQDNGLTLKDRAILLNWMTISQTISHNYGIHSRGVWKLILSMFWNAPFTLSYWERSVMAEKSLMASFNTSRPIIRPSLVSKVCGALLTDSLINVQDFKVLYITLLPPMFLTTTTLGIG